MHCLMRKKQREYQITFVADPVCWQQVPQDLVTLKNLRIGWQQGLLDSLSQNRELLFSRNGGVPGHLAFPFFIVFECLGPILELVGYAFILLAYACGLLSLQTCMAFFSVAIGLGIYCQHRACCWKRCPSICIPKQVILQSWLSLRFSAILVTVS